MPQPQMRHQDMLMMLYQYRGPTPCAGCYVTYALDVSA